MSVKVDTLVRMRIYYLLLRSFFLDFNKQTSSKTSAISKTPPTTQSMINIMSISGSAASGTDVASVFDDVRDAVGAGIRDCNIDVKRLENCLSISTCLEHFSGKGFKVLCTLSNVWRV